MNTQSHTPVASLLFAAVFGVSGCSKRREAGHRRIAPESDQNGNLQLLQYDSKGHGAVYTWLLH
jgi:hypothetical protein